MKRFVRKLGGSLYIVLTPTVIDELKIKEGEEMDIKVKGKKIIMTKTKEGK